MSRKRRIITDEDIPSREVINEEQRRLSYRKKYFKVMRTTIYALIVVVAISVLIASLVLSMVRVTGDSMMPTLEKGDAILFIKTGNLDTGDLCGFYHQNKLLIKRVIGVAGDVIEIVEDGTVWVNGEAINEPYVSENALGECNVEFPYSVPENSYFVLGDNRISSIDSRSTAIGCIEDSQIIGKAIIRIWPFSKISFVK